MSVILLASRWRAERAATAGANADSPNDAARKMSVAVKASEALLAASNAVVATARLLDDFSHDPTSVDGAQVYRTLQGLDRQLLALKCLQERMKTV